MMGPRPSVIATINARKQARIGALIVWPAGILRHIIAGGRVPIESRQASLSTVFGMDLDLARDYLGLDWRGIIVQILGRRQVGADHESVAREPFPRDTRRVSSVTSRAHPHPGLPPLYRGRYRRDVRLAAYRRALATQTARSPAVEKPRQAQPQQPTQKSKVTQQASRIADTLRSSTVSFLAHLAHNVIVKKPSTDDAG